MSEPMIPTRILDEAETYLAQAGYDLLNSTGAHMIVALERGVLTDDSDHDGIEIVIALVQRAARSAGGPRIANHGNVGEVRHYGDVHGTVQM